MAWPPQDQPVRTSGDVESVPPDGRWQRRRPDQMLKLAPDEELVLESGEVVVGPARIESLPVGLHTLTAGPRVTVLAVTDGVVRPPKGRVLSLFLASAVTDESWGCGDFRDLRRICTDARAGGFDHVSLGPIFAMPIAGECPASPYSPSSRMFLNISHICVPEVDGYQPEFHLPSNHELKGLRAGGLLVHERIRDLKLAVLRRIFREDRQRESASLSAFQEEGGSELRLFSIHCALSEALGPDWREWPQPFVDANSVHVSSWGAAHTEEVEFFAWCQYVAAKQLRHATGDACGVVLDLPVGITPGSADAWIWRKTVDFTANIGAPSDYLDPRTSRWPLVSFDPAALERSGFEPWRRTLRAAFSHGSGVRIDHAYGLFRLFKIPLDSEAGRFELQPSDQLIDVIVIEASRTSSWVVTEELGPEPPDATHRFQAEGFLSLRPYATDQFTPGRGDLWLSISCHDMPTFATLLSPEGYPDDQNVSPEFLKRASARIGELVRDEGSENVTTRALRELLRLFDPRMLVVGIDDITMERRPYNLPGTTSDQYDNFRICYPVWDEIVETETWASLSGMLDERSYADVKDEIPSATIQTELGPDDWKRLDEQLVQYAASRSDKCGALTSLDFGAGTGRLLSTICLVSKQTVAVEPDPVRRSVLENLVQRASLPGAVTVVESGRSSGLGPFDLIVCSHVIQHLRAKERLQVLSELRELSNSSCVLLMTFSSSGGGGDRHLISTPGGVTQLVSVDEFDRVPTSYGLRVWHPTIGTVRGLLREHSFVVVRSGLYRSFQHEVITGEGVSVTQRAFDGFVIARKS